MSRSRKRPYIKIPKGGKGKSFYKRLANRKVRRFRISEQLGHNGYKRIFSSWEINDYICYYPEDPKAYRK